MHTFSLSNPSHFFDFCKFRVWKMSIFPIFPPRPGAEKPGSGGQDTPPPTPKMAYFRPLRTPPETPKMTPKMTPSDPKNDPQNGHFRGRFRPIFDPPDDPPGGDPPGGTLVASDSDINPTHQHHERRSSTPLPSILASTSIPINIINDDHQLHCRASSLRLQSPTPLPSILASTAITSQGSER